MGRSCPLTTEDELMRKVCHLFDSTREKLIQEQQLPDFSFEDFVNAWDENDKFIKRLFEFFIKETAMRHFMKKSETSNVATPQASNNSYVNLVDLALNVATTPRTINSPASNIQRMLQNTIQEDQAARHAWMVSSRNLSTPRDRRRFRPQNVIGQRPMPEDEAATTRIYRTSSGSNPDRSVSNSHAALIDHAILDLLPIPSSVVSITHGLPFRRPNRERRVNPTAEEDYVRPGQVQFSHVDLSQIPQAMNLNTPSEREN